MKQRISLQQPVPGPEIPPGPGTKPEIPGREIPDTPILPPEKPKIIPEENPAPHSPPVEIPRPGNTV